MDKFLSIFKDIFYSIGLNFIGPIFLGAVTFFLLKFKDKILKTKHSFLKINEKNEQVQELLAGIRVKSEADRAFLAMFKNGDRFIDGSPMVKMSRTNESVAAGIAFDAQFYQDIFISLIPQEMNLVKEDGPIFINTEDLPDCKFRRMLVSRGIKTTARCAVKRGTQIIGFIGIDFMDKREKPLNADDLKDCANNIEQLLSSYN